MDPHTDFIGALKEIVGRAHVLTGEKATRIYRTGFRCGGGGALAVVRPGSLLELWRVVKACVAANKIVIAQAANTGLTGGSTPAGDDYDRDVVIVNTLRISKLFVIDEGRQVICLPGAIARYYPAFLARLAAEGRTLPRYVQQEFEAYLKCGLLEHGFLGVRCQDCHREKFVAFSCKRRGFCPSCGARRMVESAALLVDDILPAVPMRQWVLSVPYPLRYLFASDPASMSESLGILYRAIAAFQIKQAGLTRSQAQCGAITLIQRFGSALNLNIHFHMLLPDGVFLTDTDPPYFRKARDAPTAAQLQWLLQTLSERIGRHLERTGKWVREEERSYLALDSAGEGEDALKDLQGHSIRYRIAVGPHKGQPAFRLQSLPPLSEDRAGECLARAAGFSLHAGVATQAHQRHKLERIARYITRPPVALERLSLTAQGHIRYGLRHPYRDGTTHVIFEPLDFIARLASLVPSPRVNLTRYHGVFGSHARLRAQIVPAARGAAKKPGRGGEGAEAAASRHLALTWAQRLKRVFLIDVTVCEHCGGAMKILACIQDPRIARQILARRPAVSAPAGQLPPARGPPEGSADLLRSPPSPKVN